MLFTDTATFHQEDDTQWVEFPELSVDTEGNALTETLANAQEMLAGQLSYIIDNNLDIPKPTAIEDVHLTDGFTTLVQVDPSPFLNQKTVRKNVTVPEWLVQKADRAHVNYSEVLTDGLKAKLKLN